MKKGWGKLALTDFGTLPVFFLICFASLGSSGNLFTIFNEFLHKFRHILYILLYNFGVMFRAFCLQRLVPIVAKSPTFTIHTHTNLNVVEETIVVGSTNLNVVEETIDGGTNLNVVEETIEVD